MPDTDDKAKDRMWALLLAGDYSNCLQLARTVIEVRPDDWNARMFEGESLLKLKDYQSAVSAFSECLRINPEFFPALASRGEAYFYTGDYDNALADVEEYLKYEGTPSVYQLASVCLWKKGQTDQAYEYIDIAITNGEQGNAYVQKAGFLEEDGEYREALKYYERGAEKLPNDEKVKGKIEKLKMYI